MSQKRYRILTTKDLPLIPGGGEMVYPESSGIPIVIAGNEWGATIVNNSDNWNTAHGWGNHADAGYQAALISGTNIKTINGITLLGSGDIIISGGSGEIIYPATGIAVSNGSEWGASITNNSANWNTAYGWGNHASAGYVLSSDVRLAKATVAYSWGDHSTAGYQAALISGTNIKTINGITLLGSGDIIISGGSGEIIYPGEGIPVSTGSEWGASIIDNSSNWNTAYTHSQATHAPSNAQQNVQSDWNAIAGDALILNKPDLSSYATQSWVGASYSPIHSHPYLSDSDSRITQWNTGYGHTKLQHAPDNAEQNVQSDWDATSGDALILNKPDLSSSAVSYIKVSLNSTQVNSLGLGATLIASPGIGKAIMVVECYVKINATTPLNVSCQVLSILTSSSQALYNLENVYVETSVIKLFSVKLQSGFSAAVPSNTALIAKLSDGVNPASGSATIDFHIVYKIINY